MGSPSSIKNMVKFYGYLAGDDWLLQHAITSMGYDHPQTTQDARELIHLALRDVREVAGVHGYTRLRRVTTTKGRSFWCIAFAANDPYEGLPTHMPPEARYLALKALLQKDGPPHWYRDVFAHWTKYYVLVISNDQFETFRRI
ncbi:uncharacterized protein F5891DRAFT_1176190 [Suillus fuscotomentosus]|uniref:Uncharacterized protein n=1 Tax=Suillus fuscotomentosus TaxID=1912939 RepID=A0AAD4HEZ4_9AGAM|nr:uncharacterized protein F5891DRAFT_1176190 [Suillus fuscotomentosus]KAG1894057.1 hypothetical protein F5891DRAFT_1176190 [Suillus fuscotomentosus]